MDYSQEADTTQTFFATVQNKLHFAIHGHTAAWDEALTEGETQAKDHTGKLDNHLAPLIRRLCRF